MADLMNQAKERLRRGARVTAVRSREALETGRVRLRLQGMQRERRRALEEIGMLVCEMLDRGALDEAALRSRADAVAELDGKIAHQEREMADVHEKAKSELERDEDAV